MDNIDKAMQMVSLLGIEGVREYLDVGELANRVEVLTGKKIIEEEIGNWEVNMGILTEEDFDNFLKNAFNFNNCDIEPSDAARYCFSQQTKKSWLTQLKEEKEMNEGITTTGLRSEIQEWWSLYRVIAVDKKGCESGIPEIDTKVIAKNAEHAKGLAGVTSILDRYDYDNTKVTVVVNHITDIKPVEDDE